MKRYITLVGTATILSLSVACSSGQKEGEATSTDSLSLITVERASAELALLSNNEEFTATLQAQAKNNIAAQAGGRLQQIYVKVGDRVARGQVIARLEATQLATAEIQLQDARLNAQRMEELYKIGGISQTQWEQARSSLIIAQQQVSNLQSNTTLRSPIAGFVTTKNYDNGDMTSPTLPIAIVEQVSPIKAVIQVPERLYSKLKKGITASLKVDAIEDAHFKGYISNIYPVIDQRTHSIGVEVEFPNKDLRLRPGMYGRLLLDLGQREAIVVPDKAVQRNLGSGIRYVYVIQQGKALYREVQIGIKQGDKQEIIAGLKQGEELALTGFSLLSNGQSVK